MASKTSLFNKGVEYTKTADVILNHKQDIQWIVCDGLSFDRHKHIIDVFISEKYFVFMPKFS